MSLPIGVVRMGRRAAEARMHSTCRIERASGAPAVGADKEIHTPTVTVYEGRCRLRTVSTVTSDIEAADQLLVGQASVLSLPVDASGGIRVGDTVTFTPSADPNDDLDFALFARTMTIAGLHFDTDATARRLPVKLVT